MFNAKIFPARLVFAAGLLFLFAGCSLTDNTKPSVAPTESTPKTTKSTPRVTPKPPPVKQVCGIQLSAPKDTLAQTYYVKGERLFGDDDISGAKAALKTATCLNKNHAQASELLDLLEQTYPEH
jgi:hypothetical protein